MVAAAGIAATVATTAGSAIASSSASGKQADATSAAAAQANATQQAQLDYAKQIQQPFLDAGTGALKQTQNLLGLNGPDAATQAMSAFQASPGFGYQVQQGLSAVDNGAAARGMLRSGNTLRAEQTLGNNLASQDFTSYYNRLANLVGTGATAANALSGVALNTGAGMAQTDTSGANALSGIYGNEAGGLSSTLNNGVSNALFTANRAGWLNGSSSNPFSASAAPTVTPSIASDPFA